MCASNETESRIEAGRSGASSRTSATAGPGSAAERGRPRLEQRAEAAPLDQRLDRLPGRELVQPLIVAEHAATLGSAAAEPS